MKVFLLNVVIGFSKEHYSMAEQTSPHQISIEVLSDPASLQTNVSMIVKAQSSNSTSKALKGM